MNSSLEKRVEDGIPFQGIDVPVTSENVFEVVIQAHYQNLQACLPHIENGQLINENGEPLGDGEAPYYPGVLLAFDGATVLEKVAGRFVRSSAIRETVHTPDASTFLRQLAAEQDPDGAYIYNTAARLLSRIKGELSNRHDGDLDELLKRNLPATFLSADGSKPVTDVGTKTGIAVLTAYALNNEESSRKEKGGYFAGLVDKAIGAIEAVSKLKNLFYPTENKEDKKDKKEDKKLGRVRTVIVKRTPYNGLLGKVAEFAADGLTREFYFDTATAGPFIDAERKIIGVYKEYGRNSQGELVCTAEKRVYVMDGKLYWSREAGEQSLARSPEQSLAERACTPGESFGRYSSALDTLTAHPLFSASPSTYSEKRGKLSPPTPVCSAFF
ncbi:MAG: hypothetical protein AB1668_03280 [Nanoarchaeota archaeon]